MDCSISINKEGDYCLAHCLELGIVTTAPTRLADKKDIIALIEAPVSFAVENTNIDNLFFSALAETYKESFAKNEKDRFYFSAS